MAVVGIARFNFHVTDPNHTLNSLRLAIEEKIHLISGIQIAQNTFSLKIDELGPGPDNPPMPGFDKIPGSYRHKP